MITNLRMDHRFKLYLLVSIPVTMIVSPAEVPADSEQHLGGERHHHVPPPTQHHLLAGASEDAKEEITPAHDNVD